MAEVIGKTVCPSCGDQADLKQDKRQKWFVQCPRCGMFKYNTIKGQKILKDKVAREQEPGPGQESDQEVKIFTSKDSEVKPETAEHTEEGPELETEPPPAPIQEPAPGVSESDQKPDKKTGLIALVIGLALGGATWAISQNSQKRNQKTNQKNSQNFPGLM